jgi:hypothetical protein
MSNFLTGPCERWADGDDWRCERCWTKWAKSDDDAYRPHCCLEGKWEAEQKRRRASLDSQQTTAAKVDSSSQLP